LNKEISDLQDQKSKAQDQLAFSAFMFSRIRLYYVGSNLHVYQLYWNGSWSNKDLTVTSGAPNTAATAGGLTAFGAGTSPHVYYVGANQHVYELFINSSGVWKNSDLITVTLGQSAVFGSGLTSFLTGSDEHVYYIGIDQHLYELHWNGSWHDFDLTAGTGGPVVGGLALTSFFNGSDQHVYYEATNQHINELFWNGGWNNFDLMTATGAPNAVVGSAVTSVYCPAQNNGQCL
jgi:hypothetical protein